MAGSRADGLALRILLVEDDSDNAESLALLLRLEGHDVVVASCGLAALAAAQERLPDAVLLDLGLPGMNGWQVARQLRPLFSRKPLLVAITGFDGPQFRKRSLDEGFDYHLLKPIDPAELFLLLRRFARARS